jgi:hypothetical protein
MAAFQALALLTASDRIERAIENRAARLAAIRAARPPVHRGVRRAAAVGVGNYRELDRG